MLSIKMNSRQVPDHKSICADKNYHDILYGYLQEVSTSDVDDEGQITRYVEFPEVNFSELGRILGLSRQTVSKRMSNLEDIGLVIKNEKKKRYELVKLAANVAALIPQDTLKLLVDTLSDNSISTYVYLLSRYIANQERPFQFTLNQIKSNIGISTSTKSNDNTVTNILFILQKIGLIEYQLGTESHDSEFGNVKTIYWLNWITNDIEDIK